MVSEQAFQHSRDFYIICFLTFTFYLSSHSLRLSFFFIHLVILSHSFPLSLSFLTLSFFSPIFSLYFSFSPSYIHYSLSLSYAFFDALLFSLSLFLYEWHELSLSTASLPCLLRFISFFKLRLDLPCCTSSSFTTSVAVR